MKKTLYLIRHGQTDCNKQNIIQGRSYPSRLNELGQKQAAAFYRTYRDVPFRKVYTSTLERTTQSVQRFIDLGITYSALPDLDEISWGRFEGIACTDEIYAEMDKIASQWRQGKVTVAVENGESPETVRRRMQRAMETILANPDESPVLVATHGRSLRIFLADHFADSLADMNDFSMENLCLYLVEYDYNTQSYTLIRRHDIKHLEAVKE